MTTAEADIHSPVLTGVGFLCSAADGAWWLQQLGGRQQRGQLVGMAANLCVVAAVLARPPLSRTEAAERRSCGLDCIDGLCLRRMLLLSSGGSCARLPEPFRTLEGCNIACVVSCARTCAVAVLALPL